MVIEDLAHLRQLSGVTVIDPGPGQRQLLVKAHLAVSSCVLVGWRLDANNLRFAHGFYDRWMRRYLLLLT